MLTCLVYTQAMGCVSGETYQQHLQRAENAVKEIQPLVDAIHAYVDDKNQPPASLEELIPQYIDEIPCLHFPMSSSIRYYSCFDENWDAEEYPRFDKIWALMVPLSKKPMNFDCMYYYPDQDYSRVEEWGPVTYMGDWAYFHE